MKYVVTQLLNAVYDAGNIHESGLCTCSSNDEGFPWVMVESKLFDTYEEAEDFADKLFDKLVEEYKEQELEPGWEFVPGVCRDLYVSHEDIDEYYPEGYTDKEEWVFEINILGIEE